MVFDTETTPLKMANGNYIQAVRQLLLIKPVIEPNYLLSENRGKAAQFHFAPLCLTKIAFWQRNTLYRMNTDAKDTQTVWAIEATIAPKPLYRPNGLSERGWAKCQYKCLPGRTRVYWLPPLTGFFYRRETDYSQCALGGLLESRANVMTPHSTLEYAVGLIWLHKWSVQPVSEPLLVDLMMQRVWRLGHFSQGNPERSVWLLNWAGSDEAKAKLEESVNIVQTWQQEWIAIDRAIANAKADVSGGTELGTPS